MRFAVSLDPDEGVSGSGAREKRLEHLAQIVLKGLEPGRQLTICSLPEKAPDAETVPQVRLQFGSLLRIGKATVDMAAHDEGRAQVSFEA